MVMHSMLVLKCKHGEVVDTVQFRATILAATFALAACDGSETAATGTDQAAQETIALPGDLVPDHSSTLAQFLAANTNLRMALTSDYETWEEDKPWLAKLYDNPNPYYVATDFNGDGRGEFAAVLIDSTLPEPTNIDAGFNCVLVVFEALEDGTFMLAFMERGVGAPLGSALFHSKKNAVVQIGLFESNASPITRRSDGTYDLPLDEDY